MVTMAIDRTHAQQEPDLHQHRQQGEKRGVQRKVWRRLGAEQDNVLDSSSSLCDGPFAQAGVHLPPEPAAGSTHSPTIQTSTTIEVHTTITEQTPSKEQEQHTGHKTTEEQERQTSQVDNPRKLKVTIPEKLLSTLRANCAAKAAVSLLGRVQGKHPGLKSLTTWAKETLHPSLTLLSLKANNLFEVTFDSEEGRIHALRQADLKCESATIFFASWRPHFDSRAPQAIASLDCPVWVQVVDLCQVLREEAFLRTIGEQLGQVIAIDTSEAYKAKLLGPRIRLLVQDLDNLPQSIVIPRIDGEGEAEYELEFSGLPHQCGRCRAKDHSVRNCPKNEPDRSRKGTGARQRAGKRGRTERTLSAEPWPNPIGSTEKGECSTRNQTLKKKEKITQCALMEQETTQGEAPQGSSPGKEKLTYEAEERELLRSTPHRVEIAQDAVPMTQDIPVSSPPTVKTATSTVDQELPQEPEAELSTTPTKKGALGEPTLRPLAEAQDQEAGGAIPQLLPDEVNFPRLQTPMRSSPNKEGKGGHTAHAACSSQEPETGMTTSSKNDATEKLMQPPVGTTQEPNGDVLSLLPDDVNFPRLQTPKMHSPSPNKYGREDHNSPTPQLLTPQTGEKPATTFVWGPKPIKAGETQTEEVQADKGKSKAKLGTPKTLESTPLTRQGYRSGRLAEYFWIALGIPNLP